jgi:hypothetical protein
LLESGGSSHASQRCDGLVDGDRHPGIPVAGPQPGMARDLAHSSTVKSAKRWQRLYPDKKEFNEICSEIYPTYVVSNYKSKKFCCFITVTHNTILPRNRDDTGL